MRVLLTGAYGLVGSAILARLLVATALTLAILDER